ncbi:phosphoesterase DHHA1 [Arcobacter nitrofigilis DSM 7299]|uniref:Phosphoesterase DHHA1 n=1 Tax=Arcobacter nitrofigilis (strain ATCC 33309 / DSM 7299 / CCUG 15893 / LMG 7604 / NCTC 12251 / CI) TaxID=572480 RepID=D5V231_ARCNC|nr:phosphoesterase [Arcobacter nitrofigilis]ADG92264.1 phosphoesterase DHHA1 [Arcobacter nitrofigilis DSM 7299]
MILFHISHTDLDGYGCQLLTKEIFSQSYYLNANYGLEVKQSIIHFIEHIINEEIKDEILFLITDVNLTNAESKYINNEVIKLNEDGYKIKLQLLDHHATGQSSAEKYDWYFLDTSRCATKIVYDYFVKNYNAFQDESQIWIEPLVNSINAIDIWIEDNQKDFEFGKVLLSMVSHVREINNVLFANKNRDFRIHLLKKASLYLNEVDGNIKLDSAIHSLKKEFLNLDGKDDTIDNLSAKYLVNSITSIKDELTINFQDKKGVLTYTLGGISIPANAFLKANKDYDFFIDVSKRGNASFRADGNLDVGLLAQKLANGGGHPNASGCKFDDFKEVINYSDVKKYIQNKLNNIKI